MCLEWARESACEESELYYQSALDVLRNDNSSDDDDCDINEDV